MTATKTSQRLILALAGLVWAGAIVGGFGMLIHEGYTPVPATSPGSQFPRSTGLALDAKRPTLLLFAHPQCPCTRATLHELNELLADTAGKVDATMVFVLPPGAPHGFEQGPLWKAASGIPGLRRVIDAGGRMAESFHVIGSGHVLLFDPSGKLLFSGGITGSRGHEGDNAGRDAVESLVLTGKANLNRTPVFGCQLL